MPVQQKNPVAGEFNAKAQVIRKDMLDPAKTFTMEQLNAMQAEVAVLDARAQIAAGFTPKEEIEHQGGDLEVGGSIRGTPENRDIDDGPSKYSGLYDANGIRRENRRAETKYQREMRSLAANIEEVFGGPNSMILALARRGVQALTGPQQKILDKLDRFTVRTITGETGGTSGAEFLLPLQQEQSIFRVVNFVDGILATARRYTVAGRSLRIPYLKQTYDGNTRPMAGIAQVTVVDEAAQKPIREPTFGQRLLLIYAIKAYCEFGDETWADDMTGDLVPAVQEAVGGEIQNEMNALATIDGNGTGTLMGAFNPANPSLITVEREASNEIHFSDVTNMLARFMGGPQSRWYVTPSGLPQLLQMTLGNNTLVTWIQDMRGNAQMQLMGYPVILTPLMPLLGTQADLSLGNGAFYAFALRQALTIESSIHYKFRDDMTAYRFVTRGGGIPIPDGTYSYKAPGSNKEWPMSPFVALDDQQAS